MLAGEPRGWAKRTLPDFAEPCSELPGAVAARAHRVEDFDLAEFAKTSLTQFCPTSWAVATTHVKGWVPSRFNPRMLASDLKVLPVAGPCRRWWRWRHWAFDSAASRQDAAACPGSRWGHR